MEKSGVYCLKDKQRQAIVHILQPQDFMNLKNDYYSITKWKVLIFDQFCSDLMSLQFVVSDLRELGITMMLLLDNKRQSIPDVDAVYYVRPTVQNLKQIIKDINNDMYATFSICFTNELPQEQMSLLVNSLVKSQRYNTIEQLVNSTTNFHVLDDNLFTFSQSLSYKDFNDPHIDEAQGNFNIEFLTTSLFNVFLTLKDIPIIRTRSGRLEDIIAQKLVKKLYDFNIQNPHYFQRNDNKRYLLVITNRNYDISTGLVHGWNYQALMGDITQYQYHRIFIDGKWVDMNSESEIWKECKHKIIAEVAECIKKNATTLEHEKEKLRNQKNELFEEKSTWTLDESSYRLCKDLERDIEFHTNIAGFLVKEIKNRELDLLFSYEDNIMARSDIDPLSLVTFLNRITNEKDLIRFYYICLLNDMDLTELDKIIQNKNIQLKSIEYIKYLKQSQEYLMLSKKEKRMKRSTLGGMVGDVFGKVVKTLLPKSKKMPVTVLMDNLCNCKSTSLESEYTYYDPRLSCDTINENRRNIPFKDSVVFVIGGGNYSEYANITEYANSNNKRILYGATQLLGGEDLLKQIDMLN